jgi:hypothetical protein
MATIAGEDKHRLPHTHRKSTPSDYDHAHISVERRQGQTIGVAVLQRQFSARLTDSRNRLSYENVNGLPPCGNIHSAALQRQVPIS